MCETCISRLVPPWVSPDIGVTVKDRPSACVLVEEAEATAAAAVLIGRARWASIWLASIWAAAGERALARSSSARSECSGGQVADRFAG